MSFCKSIFQIYIQMSCLVLQTLSCVHCSLFTGFPRATHNCPPTLVQDYLCGKPTTCNCTLISEGRPKGYALWFEGTIPILGPLVVSYDGTRESPIKNLCTIYARRYPHEILDPLLQGLKFSCKLSTKNLNCFDGTILKVCSCLN